MVFVFEICVDIYNDIGKYRYIYLLLYILVDGICNYMYFVIEV